VLAAAYAPPRKLLRAQPQVGGAKAAVASGSSRAPCSPHQQSLIEPTPFFPLVFQNFQRNMVRSFKQHSSLNRALQYCFKTNNQNSLVSKIFHLKKGTMKLKQSFSYGFSKIVYVDQLPLSFSLDFSKQHDEHH
jgi:hypothetical protein